MLNGHSRHSQNAVTTTLPRFSALGSEKNGKSFLLTTDKNPISSFWRLEDSFENSTGTMSPKYGKFQKKITC